MSESTTLALMERDKRIAELERKLAELQAAYEEQAEFIRRYQGGKTRGRRCAGGTWTVDKK